MAEPFKNLLNRDVIKGMASHFNQHSDDFDQQGFIDDAINGLDLLELKERSTRITETMVKHLPADFKQAGDIILSSLGKELGDEISAGAVDEDGIAGWAITPMADFVGLYGHDHFELSMLLFKEMTKRASSEFGIRFFILKQPTKTLNTLKTWALDSDHHVRRLISEGSRPKLPWAMHLPAFIEDPTPVIALLEILKDDESEYVRRSVANSLNDIAKDHPDLVAGIAEKWMVNASNKRIKLIRHACRTLIKNGHEKTLSVFGYHPPALNIVELTVQTPKVTFGEALAFTLSISGSINQTQPLVIDYVVHHQKANGKTSPKVFKWRTASLVKDKPLTISKKHPIKHITTRKYYAGLHSVEVLVNGQSVGKADFELSM